MIALLLSKQFDAVLHFDQTRAVQPLDHSAAGHNPVPPETFPSGVNLTYDPARCSSRAESLASLFCGLEVI